MRSPLEFFLTRLEAKFEKKALNVSAFVLSSKHGLPLLFRQILEDESFPDDSPRDFKHFHSSLGFPIFSLSLSVIKDFFFLLITREHTVSSFLKVYVIRINLGCSIFC